jgi:hypothetical protein
MYSKVSSDWLPRCIRATRTVLEIFKMAGYFPDSPRIHQFLRKFTSEKMECMGEMMKRTHFSGRKKKNLFENLKRIILKLTL